MRVSFPLKAAAWVKKIPQRTCLKKGGHKRDKLRGLLRFKTGRQSCSFQASHFQIPDMQMLFCKCTVAQFCCKHAGQICNQLFSFSRSNQVCKWCLLFTERRRRTIPQLNVQTHKDLHLYEFGLELFAGCKPNQLMVRNYSSPQSSRFTTSFAVLISSRFVGISYQARHLESCLLRTSLSFKINW